MSSRFKYGVYVALLAVCFFAGWACDKFSGNNAGISPSQVVATVDGQQITFGQWMSQMDLLRVFETPVDPGNSQQVKGVLETLINQELILQAAQKANYADPNFDEYLKNKLLQSDERIKDQKGKLEQDLAAVKRVEKDYKEAYKKVLLAQGYASNQISKIDVSDKDMKTWYTQYSAQAAAAGQPGMRPYSSLTSDIKKEIKQNIQAEKFLDQLQAGGQVTRNDDVIKKYLDSLSPSQGVLDGSGAGQAVSPAQADSSKQ
ncbi:MAG TPA: SurA N-terminal domain-containing protein [bacterium]|nr:SurA N-terminal domain-containing protein [bacterium]